MSELRLIEEGEQISPETLKELRRLKRLKRTVRRKQARISGKPHKEKQLIQSKTVYILSWQQRTYLWVLGIALTFAGIASISRNAWNQGDNELCR